MAGLRSEVNATSGEVRTCSSSSRRWRTAGRSRPASRCSSPSSSARPGPAGTSTPSSSAVQHRQTQESGQQPDARLAAPARPPIEPSSPDRKLLLAGAASLRAGRVAGGGGAGHPARRFRRRRGAGGGDRVPGARGAARAEAPAAPGPPGPAGPCRKPRTRSAAWPSPSTPGWAGRGRPGRPPHVLGRGRGQVAARAHPGPGLRPRRPPHAPWSTSVPGARRSAASRGVSRPTYAAGTLSAHRRQGRAA